MRYWLEAGYPYELAGLLYFLFYLRMMRGTDAARFSQRTKILTLVASIVLVGSVPLHYGATAAGIVAMFGFVVLAVWSTLADRRSPPPPG